MWGANGGRLRMDATNKLGATLREEGVVLLRGCLPAAMLTRFRDAAVRCLESIEHLECIPARYRFISQVHSLMLASLLEFGIENEGELTAPLADNGLVELFSDLMGVPWRCRLEHSWLRKKFAPCNAPASARPLQNWHQDGALGIQFTHEPGPPIRPVAMTTCWIPLDRCGADSPGLEFIRKLQPYLLHFTELDDALLRRRFDASHFWAPELELGDAMLFRGDVLHRTYLIPEMRADRMSIEYRIFPA